MSTFLVFLGSVTQGHQTDLAAVQNRVFFSVSEAQAYCSGQLCDASSLASNNQGWMCPTYQATNPATHQHVYCQYGGSWVKTPAAPSDCQFNNEYQCQVNYNNCWNTPSSNCDSWCTCENHAALGSSLGEIPVYNSAGGTRLGGGGGGYGDETSTRLGSSLGEIPVYNSAGTRLGGGGGGYGDEISTRLGSSLGGAAQPCPIGTIELTQGEQCGGAPDPCALKRKCKFPLTCQMDGVNPGGFGTCEYVLGHSGGHDCPWYLPQAQDQLTPGSLGVSCWNKGQLCKYPSYGMNFVCTGNNGVWQLQGAPPSPTPAPQPVCPAWWTIWSGWTRCSCGNGYLCKYPSQHTNYVCTNGFWIRQGNPPAPAPTPRPTPAPVNSVECPSSSHYLKDGNYCTTKGQRCNYPNGDRFLCSNTGVWQRQWL